MAEDSQPPKPKVGSLRDRIAAFEAKPAAPAPAPRPKPGNVQWKPKPAPSSPPAPSSDANKGDVAHGSPERKPVKSGMSVADAKESIGMGGSLKARMAALQNKHAFDGGNAAPPPPKPATEKPKWKPPPVVSPPADEDEGPMLQHDSGEVKSPPATDGPEEEVEASQEGEIEAQPDADEEERQRRAAIAARLARLGGARVGMGPPVFGTKPQVKKTEKPSPDKERGAEEAPKDTGNSPELEKGSEGLAQADDVKGIISPTHSPTAERDAAAVSQTSLISNDSDSLKSARSPPSSMPVPSGPRRAGPPRRRPAKSPSPSATTVLQESSNVQDDHASADAPTPSGKPVLEDGSSADAVTPVDRPNSPHLRDEKKDSEFEHQGEIDIGLSEQQTDSKHLSASLDASEEERTNEESKEPSDSEGVRKESDAPPSGKSSGEIGDAAKDEEDEEDEDTRRRRIAERIAKSGGFNPFGVGGPPPPPRRQSSTLSTVPVPPSATLEEHATPLHSPPVPKSENLEQEFADIDLQGSAAKNLVEESDEHLERTASKEVQDDRDHETHEIIEEADKPDSATSIDLSEDAAHGIHEVDDDTVDDGKDGNATSASQRSSIFQPEASFLQLTPTQEDEDDQDLPVEREEDEEMAPPRIQRPLPPQPTLDHVSSEIPHKATAEQTEQLSHAGPPSKRRSLPPPRAPPPPPSVLPQIPQGNADDSIELASPLSTSIVDHEHDTMNKEEIDRGQGQFSEEAPQDSRQPLIFRAVKPVLNLGSKPSFKDTSQEERDARFPLTPTFPPPPPLPPNRPMRSASLSPPPLDTARVRSPPFSPPVVRKEQEQEIIDEEDGDPIDPTFHSPTRSSESSLIENSGNAGEETNAAIATEVTNDVQSGVQDGDSEAIRRRTIAERVAKLGGVKFGAPIPRPNRAPPPPSTDDYGPDNEDKHVEQPGSASPPPEDEDESARKARISARLASMGGFLFAPIAPPKSPAVARPRSASKETEIKSNFAPPPRVPPPPPAAVVEVSISDNESGSPSVTGSDLTRIEAEDSEPDLITHDEVANHQEEETPPPIPSRASRPSMPQRKTSDSRFVEELPPSPSSKRTISPSTRRPSSPIIPTGQHSRRGTSSSSRRVSGSAFNRPTSPYAPPPFSADFVMVDEPRAQEEEQPPPPPPRRASTISSRKASMPAPPLSPPPPPPTLQQKRSSGVVSDSEWALPNIPTIPPIDLGQSSDLSASGWSEDSTSYPEPPPPPPPSHSRPAPPAKALPSVQSVGTPTKDVQLSADELLALWGRVGVHIGEVAESLHDKSRKMLVGDGTFRGFVRAVLAQVPHATVPCTSSQHEFGHLVYAQSGATVQRRASDIMPGDIITLEDARFKGHKGLHQSYQQVVGAEGEAVLGVVGEFEHKKSKVRVYEANQHVGAQSVEMVSYRLEDLKSGSVMVYRVSDS